MNKKKHQGMMSQMAAMTCRAAAILGVVGALLAAPAAQAAPITTDLSISGSVAFDSTNSYANPGSSSSGDLKSMVGGVAITDAYSGSTGGSLAGNLTQTGDGFGFAGTASSSGANGTSLFETYIDIALDLTNNSATDTYRINFSMAFANAVDANGTDAYADSEFFVRDPAGGADLFFTDILSDTAFGDEIAGVPTGNFGAALSESGSAGFSITLLPGASVLFGPTTNPILWRLLGGAYEPDSSSAASLDAFLSIASVDNLTLPPNPNPTPEPAILALLGIGLMGIGALRRRATR